MLLQLSVDQLQGREYSEALETAFKALKQDPNYEAAYNQLALIYMETKRLEKSEAAFLKALELKPAYPEVFNNLGVLKNRQRQYQQAVTYFKKALADNQYATPENALTNMGYSYYKLGQLSQAKREHQRALDVMPQFCLARKNLADVYAKEKNYGKAAESYEQAMTTCPLYQEAQYKLGLALMKMGKRKVARGELEKLVDRHKTGPYVRRSSEVLKFLQ